MLQVGYGSEGGHPSRYECKYLVSHGVAAEIRRFIEPFMVPDEYARARDGHRYPICSLYLDTPGLHLYRQTAAGEKNRFKLRVRSYSDEAATPVYLEVKRRIDDVILKRRASLSREAATELIATGDSVHLRGQVRDEFSDIECFKGHLTVAAALPFLRIRYIREAYEAVGGDPLRITLDTDIAWLPTTTTEFHLDSDGWIPTGVPGTVLEIKFTDRYPAWVGEMIRIFDLHRESVAKYVLSVDSFFAESRASAPRRRPGPPPGWDGRPAWAREAE